MASNIMLTSLRPPAVRASAADGRRRPPAAAAASWWTPLFGWSPEPDYIDGPPETAPEGGGRPARRFGAFTEEKARELRMKTRETEVFHDVMYHSAIASRLAADGPHRAGGAGDGEI